jgi:hypothetical protein
LATPFVRVNSQFEPLRLERSVARKAIRTLTVSPTGSTPPSGTTIVWSSTVAPALAPSTDACVILRPPSRAAIVLSSSRSTGPPDVFVAVRTVSTRIARVPKSRPSLTS